MWNTEDPVSPGEYLVILYKAATASRGLQQWLSIEEWEGKSWNCLGNVYTTVIAWQPLPKPYSEENPGEWITEVDMYFENRNVPLNGEEVLVSVYNWETEETSLMLTIFIDGAGFECEIDDPDLNVDGWQRLPILVK